MKSDAIPGVNPGTRVATEGGRETTCGDVFLVVLQMRDCESEGAPLEQ